MGGNIYLKPAGRTTWTAERLVDARSEQTVSETCSMPPYWVMAKPVRPLDSL